MLLNIFTLFCLSKSGSCVHKPCALLARQAIWEQARKLELMDKILYKSKLTEQEALEIGREINKGIAKRHGLIK